MILPNHCAALDNFHPGDIIWACCWKPTQDLYTEVMHQKPIKGMLAAGKTLQLHQEAMMHDDIENIPCAYFVPYKIEHNASYSNPFKNELDWNRAVKTENRRFATTEEDCYILYAQILNAAIDTYKQDIDRVTRHHNQMIRLLQAHWENRHWR